MAVTALYRKSSGEVLKISPKGQTFSDADTTYWGVLTDPTRPDGDEVRELLPDGTLGPLRVLGFAKIADTLLNIVRNALQLEIDTFAPAQQSDEDQQDADAAADMGDRHPQFRRLIKSILKGIIRENNIQAARYNELRSALLAATNLNDLKIRIQDNTANMPTRTNQQAFDAVRNDVSATD